MKGRLKERELKTRGVFPSAGSFPRWPEQPELGQFEGRNFYISIMGTGVEVLGPSYTSFPGALVGSQIRNRITKD